MGNYIFNREEEENKVHKKAVLDNKKKTILSIILFGLVAVGTVAGCFFNWWSDFIN